MIIVLSVGQTSEWKRHSQLFVFKGCKHQTVAGTVLLHVIILWILLIFFITFLGVSIWSKTFCLNMDLASFLEEIFVFNWLKEDLASYFDPTHLNY